MRRQGKAFSSSAVIFLVALVSTLSLGLSLAGCGAGQPSTSQPTGESTAMPVFSLASGTYTSAQTVAISSSTSGASIYYTTNGSTPTTSSTLYTGPITVSTSETLEAIATASGSSASAVASAAYVINLAAGTPTFSVAGGTYTSAQTVAISSSTSGASIYYTTNGSTPTTSSTLYTGPITVSTSETLEAIATASGSSASAVASAAYVINLAAGTPTFSVAGGTYTSAQTVAISSSTSGASIYYTTNGSTPTTSSTLYTGPITVSTSETLEAIATASGSSASAVASAAYVINLAAGTPTFSVAGGTYTSAQTVAISSSTSGASIYYTTNGSTPTTSSTLYTGPITVSTSETLEAIATASGSSASAVASAAYVINLAAGTPTFSVAGGTYTSAQTVAISSSTSGASIYYTTNGSTPTTSSTLYTGPITVSTSETLEAIATASGSSASAVASAAYVINLAGGGLVFNPPSLSFPVTAVGFASAPLAISMNNATSSVITFSGFAVAGPNGSDFSQVNNCGVPLQPSQSCTAQVIMTPSDFGVRSAVFMVNSNASNSPQSVTLSGTGASPNAGPTNLSASQLSWTTAGLTQDIQLQNQGNTTLTVRSVASSDPSFVITGTNCIPALPAQSVCTISVVSNGQSENNPSLSPVTFNGTLTVTDDDAQGPQTATLTSTNTEKVTNSIGTSGAIDFGVTPVGVPVNDISFVRGTTHETQGYFSGVIVGPDANDFSPSPADCSGVGGIPMWESCQFTLTFTPPAGGTRTAKLQSNQANVATGYISLTGTALGTPGAAFSAPQQVAVGAVFNAAGQASGSSSFTILNTGSDTLSFLSFPITSSNPLLFTTSGNCASLAPGLTCTVSVTYSTLTPGNATATILLRDSISAVSADITVLATTGYQGLTTSPTQLTFGPQSIGAVSATQSATVGDSNGQPLGHALSAVVSDGVSNFTLVQGATCPASTTELCTMAVNFTSGSAGMVTGQIMVTDSVSGFTDYIGLTGIVVGNPVLSLSTNSVVFPLRTVGSTSIPMVVTLTNTGSSSLTISSVTVQNAVGNNFSQTNNCTTVAPNATCAVNATFAPVAAGSQSASIQIVSNAGSSPDTISLTGTAQ